VALQTRWTFPVARRLCLGGGMRFVECRSSWIAYAANTTN